jgi:hypothetical protein
MIAIHRTCFETAKEYGTPGNLVNGANIGGFLKVANSDAGPGTGVVLYRVERSTPSCLALISGERILDLQIAKSLSVLQIFAVQNATAGLDGCRHN